MRPLDGLVEIQSAKTSKGPPYTVLERVIFFMLMLAIFMICRLRLLVGKGNLVDVEMACDCRFRLFAEAVEGC